MQNNSLNFLQQAQLGKNQGWRYLLTFLIVAFSIGGVMLLLNLFVIPPLKEWEWLRTQTNAQPIVQYLLTGLAFSAQLLGIYLAIRYLHRRSFASLNAVGKFPFLPILEGVLVWGGLLFLCDLFTDSGFVASLQEITFSWQALAVLPIAILSVGVQSYTEEVIFRGYLNQSLSLRIKKTWILFGVSSVIFGLLHLTGGLDHLLFTTLFGIAFCIVVQQRQNIAFATGIHFVNNFYLSFLFPSSEDSAAGEGFFEMDWQELLTGVILFGLLIGYTHLRKSLVRRPVPAL